VKYHKRKDSRDAARHRHGRAERWEGNIQLTIHGKDAVREVGSNRTRKAPPCRTGRVA